MDDPRRKSAFLMLELDTRWRGMLFILIGWTSFMDAPDVIYGQPLDPYYKIHAMKYKRDQVTVAFICQWP